MISFANSNSYKNRHNLLPSVKLSYNTKPTEEALERYLVTLFEDYNFKQSQRIHKGFGQCSDILESLFD